MPQAGTSTPICRMAKIISKKESSRDGTLAHGVQDQFRDAQRWTSGEHF